MHRHQKHDKRSFVLGACLLVIVAAVLITIGIQAKYVTSVPLTGSVTFSANLSEDVTLTEHKVIRQSNGTYTLNPLETTTENHYVVMPGVDIPKDPFITVTNKTDIDAYLYVEIVEKNLPGTVTYSLTDQWTELEIEGRNVYVYNGTLAPAFTGDIPILKDDKLIISDQYDPSSTEFQLEFYGYMAQIVGDTKTKAEIFTSNFPTVPGT